MPDMHIPADTAAGSHEWLQRVDLAAAFRMVARLDWHEGIANHFSAAVSDDGRRFILNPKWRHFSMLKASDLLVLDADDRGAMEGPDAPDPTAWHLHGTIHARVPAARCVMHLHSPYATALSCLEDPEIKPIDQTTARFFGRVALDGDYGGMADNADEADRICRLLGTSKTLMMGNHGVLVTGTSVADAFDTLYHLERACRTLVLAYSTGRPVKVLSDAVAAQTAAGWDKVAHACFSHFAEVRRMLDQTDPGYAL